MTRSQVRILPGARPAPDRGVVDQYEPLLGRAIDPDTFPPAAWEMARARLDRPADDDVARAHATQAGPGRHRAKSRVISRPSAGRDRTPRRDERLGPPGNSNLRP